MSRFFEADEIEGYVYDSSAVVVEEDHGSGRWVSYMSTIFKADDGKFYSVDWSKGLTEMQEDEFSDETLDEVFPVESLKVSSVTEYVTDVSKVSSFSLDKETLEAAELISGTAKSGLDSLKSYDTAGVLDFLDKLDGVILDKEGVAFLKASKAFFRALNDVSEQLS